VETFGNGVPIGTAHTAVTMRPIQQVHHRVGSVCFAVAVGPAMRTAVALRFGIGTFQASGAATAGSGLFCPQFVEAKQASSSPEEAEHEG
jgi:hypothetical protein